MKVPVTALINSTYFSGEKKQSSQSWLIMNDSTQKQLPSFGHETKF